jgi:hypothetical protein
VEISDQGVNKIWDMKLGGGILDFDLTINVISIKMEGSAPVRSCKRSIWSRSIGERSRYKQGTLLEMIHKRPTGPSTHQISNRLDLTQEVSGRIHNQSFVLTLWNRV